MSSSTDLELKKVLDTIQRCSASLLGTSFKFRVERDNKRPEDGRIFIQCVYVAACNKTGELLEWHGSKYYLSEYMTDDEIVKKAFVAFRDAVNHEVMEGFKVDGIVLFNPHTHFEELLKVSTREISRT